MKPIYLLFAPFSLILLSGCVYITPQNLNFDSAKMMKKKSIEIQGNASLYPDFEQMNFGGKIGIGVSENYNIKLRYEAMLSKNYNNRLEWNYFEIDNKLRLAKWCALSLPLGGYSSQVYNERWLHFKPSLYFTATFNNKVDISIIPKGQLLWEKKTVGILSYFGLSIGAGFSSNLDLWAIRPEFGWDQFSNFSGGISFSYYIKSKKEN